MSEIHDVIRQGDLEKLRTLLDGQPVLISSVDENGTTPLHRAAARGHRGVLEILLAKNADVNAKDNVGCSPLHNAVCGSVFHYDQISHVGCSGGEKVAAELLIESGADINIKDNDRGWTPLHHAASIGATNMVVLLLSNGADVDAQSGGGHSPLSLASSKVAQLLKARQAGPFSTDPYSYIETSKALLAKGADSNVNDDSGRSYLNALLRSR
jgi:ankyrin repeat protein